MPPSGSVGPHQLRLGSTPHPLDRGSNFFAGSSGRRRSSPHRTRTPRAGTLLSGASASRSSTSGRALSLEARLASSRLFARLISGASPFSLGDPSWLRRAPNALSRWKSRSSFAVADSSSAGADDRRTSPSEEPSQACRTRSLEPAERLDHPLAEAAALPLDGVSDEEVLGIERSPHAPLSPPHTLEAVLRDRRKPLWVLRARVLRARERDPREECDGVSRFRPALTNA